METLTGSLVLPPSSGTWSVATGKTKTPSQHTNGVKNVCKGRRNAGMPRAAPVQWEQVPSIQLLNILTLACACEGPLVHTGGLHLVLRSRCLIVTELD
eukprot:958705-Amphidinium_carterae.2